MQEVFANPTVRAGAAVLVLCVLIFVGFYFVSIFRDYAAEDRETPPDVLANLEEMHRKGDISEAEFRTIQATTHRQPVGPSDTDASSPPDDASPNS